MPVLHNAKKGIKKIDGGRDMKAEELKIGDFVELATDNETSVKVKVIELQQESLIGYRVQVQKNGKFNLLGIYPSINDERHRLCCINCRNM